MTLLKFNFAAASAVPVMILFLFRFFSSQIANTNWHRDVPYYMAECSCLAQNDYCFGLI
jgi:hypothetical protein